MTKMVMRDFNAELGKEEYLRGVVRSYSLHDTPNNNRHRTESAVASNIIVKSTQFERKDIFKITWTTFL